MTDYARGRADALKEVVMLAKEGRMLWRVAQKQGDEMWLNGLRYGLNDLISRIEALAQQTQPPLDEAEALIDEAYDERDKWLFKYRDAVRLIMEINQFLASKGIVHPTKLSNQIISTIKDATEHIGSLAQQPQTEPERGCGTCNSWTGSRCVDLEFPIRDCINDSYSEWQPKEGA